MKGPRFTGRAGAGTVLIDRAKFGARMTPTHDAARAAEHAEAEAALHKSQRLEALGRLAGTVAHDFNNILAIVQSYTELALLELPADGNARSDLGHVLDAAAQGAALAKQLLMFGRQHAAEPQPIDVNAAVQRMAALLGGSGWEAIRFRSELTAEPCTIRVDATQFNQVLLNLAVNARDAMPHGGTLSIRTAVVAAAGGAAAGGNGDPEDGEFISISVEDTGVGIPDEVLPRIFEPFYTTKAAGTGTGLGLATVYAIVRQSGGTVTVESRQGEGTRFVVLLPRHVRDDAGPAGGGSR